MTAERTAKSDARRARGERTRHAILQACVSLMGRVGMQGLTARRIAAEAGVSPATVFHHFASVDAVILESAFMVLDGFAEDVRRAATDSLESYLRGWGTMTVRFLREQPEMARTFMALIGRVLFDARLQERMREALQIYLRDVEADLARLVPTGTPRERLRHAALSLILLGDATVLHWAILENTKHGNDDAPIFDDVDKVERYWHEAATHLARWLPEEA